MHHHHSSQDKKQPPPHQTNRVGARSMREVLEAAVRLVWCARKRLAELSLRAHAVVRERQALWDAMLIAFVFHSVATWLTAQFQRPEPLLQALLLPICLAIALSIQSKHAVVVFGLLLALGVGKNMLSPVSSLLPLGVDTWVASASLPMDVFMMTQNTTQSFCRREASFFHGAEELYGRPFREYQSHPLFGKEPQFQRLILSLEYHRQLRHASMASRQPYVLVVEDDAEAINPDTFYFEIRRLIEDDSNDVVWLDNRNAFSYMFTGNPVGGCAAMLYKTASLPRVLDLIALDEDTLTNRHMVPGGTSAPHQYDVVLAEMCRRGSVKCHVRSLVREMRTSSTVKDESGNVLPP